MFRCHIYMSRTHTHMHAYIHIYVLHIHTEEFIVNIYMSYRGVDCHLWNPRAGARIDSWLSHIVLIGSTNVVSCFQALKTKGYELVSGGTDNHLVLVNLKSKVILKLFLFFFCEKQIQSKIICGVRVYDE